MDDLEKIIRPIVEGQTRGFLKEHPSIVEAVDWYKPRSDKATTFINSLGKRIVRDLVCGKTTARMKAALLEPCAGMPPGSKAGMSPGLLSQSFVAGTTADGGDPLGIVAERVA